MAADGQINQRTEERSKMQNNLLKLIIRQSDVYSGISCVGAVEVVKVKGGVLP